MARRLVRQVRLNIVDGKTSKRSPRSSYTPRSMAVGQRLRAAIVGIVLGCSAACTSILGRFSVSPSDSGGPLDASAASDSACKTSFCASTIAANGNHTCAVQSTGSVVCWGDDTSGSDGPGGVTGHKMAVVTGLPGPAVSVRVGIDFACAVMLDASVWCWGDNLYDMLGGEGGVEPDGASMTSATPLKVLPEGSVSDLAVGSYHACAKLIAGQIKCWGRNGFGQAGVAKMLLVDTPTDLDLTDVNSLSAGSFETCFQRSSVPHAECMGENLYGELGLGNPADGGAPTDDSPHPVPQAVALDSSWAGVTSFAHSAGFHMGAVLQSGEVAMWGDDDDGQLGLGSDAGSALATPELVPTLTGVTQLSLMQHASCALRIDQTVWCWGSTAYGETGSTANVGPVQAVPTQVQGLMGVSHIATGSNHVCALLTDGNVECWGWNASGQLGRATAAAYDPAPMPVEYEP